MNSTPNDINNSKGCPDAIARDGDIGAKEGPAVQRPEASSINKVNPPAVPGPSTHWDGTTNERDEQIPLPFRAASSNAACQRNAREGGILANDDIHREDPIDPQPVGRFHQEHSQPPPPLDEEHYNEHQRQRKDKRRKVTITFATLNIHGKQDIKKRSKIKPIATLMRKERITIMAVQELRCDEEAADALNLAHPNVVIVNNGNTTSKEGVGFIIDKKRFCGKNKTYQHSILIQNRASRLKVDWNGEHFDLINVYAPNAEADKCAFLTELNDAIRNCDDLENPILLGDWNFVEDTLDRSPPRTEPERITDLFNVITRHLQLVDGWKSRNPDTCSFTFNLQGTNIMSRIDRIYCTKEQLNRTMMWGHTSSAKLSDHDIAFVSIIRNNMPHLGSGISRLSAEIIDYGPFQKPCAELLHKAQTAMDNEPHNIQTL